MRELTQEEEIMITNSAADTIEFTGDPNQYANNVKYFCDGYKAALQSSYPNNLVEQMAEALEETEWQLLNNIPTQSSDDNWKRSVFLALSEYNKLKESTKETG